MLPKERVIAALEHREGDRVPVGELHADREIIEAAIGRSAYVNSKWRNGWPGGRAGGACQQL